MKNLAIIPARSGSKGLKDKNIKPLNGLPMMVYSIRAAQEANIFDEIMVSTDSNRYAYISKEFGASVPFMRSEEYSGSRARSWDVVKEVLDNYQKIGKRYDTVCLLQPTSPLRTAEDILNGYIELKKRQADAITSVCEAEHSPLWMTPLSDDNSLSKYREKAIDAPRQQLQTFYRINGALYIRKIQYVENDIILLNRKEYAYIMERRRSVDIDTIFDFELAEYLLGRDCPKADGDAGGSDTICTRRCW